MFEMGPWDWVLLSAAAYLAVVGIVRLMRSRRDEIVEDLSFQVDLEMRRQSLEKKSEEHRKKVERLNQRAG